MYLYLPKEERREETQDDWQDFWTDVAIKVAVAGAGIVIGSLIKRFSDTGNNSQQCRNCVNCGNNCLPAIREQ